MANEKRKAITFGRWAYILAAILSCASVTKAADVWKTLPPTPSLPAPVKSGYAPVDGIQIWYAVFGKGRPVLLLHGGLANSDYWGNLVPVLVRNQFEVIVADSRGHGRSTRSGQPYSYDLMASDMIALLDYLKLPKVDLVGWSDGGIIGIDLAVHHPERLNSLFAFGANTDPSGLIDNFDKTPVFSSFIKRSEQEYKRLSKTPDQYNSFVEQIGRMWATQPNFTDAQLRAIRVRTTIADGQYDEGIKQSHTAYIAHTIPKAKLIILPNLSHFAALQDPAAFNAAVMKALANN
jgi:pimeloyl-ACP methyl ester carboxylesterase